ncbi:MAG: DUF4180 domain-containing protein [Bacteroidia bacterium]
MEFIYHTSEKGNFVELKKASLFIDSIEKGADLAADVYYNQLDGLILHKEDIHDDFFELKSGFAGELLQKFSNFRLQLVIVGDFSNLTSKSIQDFIRESNALKRINFINSLDKWI